MDENFVTYNQALALKGIGFNEKCMAWYRNYGYNVLICDLSSIHPAYLSEDSSSVVAPLKQQVFKWFRDKYGLFVAPSVISYENNPYLWFFEINSTVLPFGTDLGETIDFKTYEEAESACIDKLIDLKLSNKIYK